MQIETAFEPGQFVIHICDTKGVQVGIVTAFMVRGQNHSYEVSWDVDDSKWHLDYELIAAPRTARQQPAIGWRQDA